MELPHVQFGGCTGAEGSLAFLTFRFLPLGVAFLYRIVI